MERRTDTREQRILKRLYQVQGWFSGLALNILCFFMIFCLVGTIYYGFCRIRGMEEGKRFVVYAGGFLMFAAACGAIKLFEALLDRIHRNEYEFEPRTMELPRDGTVDLETALHHMAVRTGVIGWDTVFGTLLIILLGMMFTLGGNIPLILLVCLILAVLLAGGHLFFSRRWRKRCFAVDMLKNTGNYMNLSSGYAKAVEASLAEGVLYYAREMILTRLFIIGMTETDISFHPVAVARSEITQLTFFCRRPVMSRFRKYDMGRLECRLQNGQSMELLIGQGPRMGRVLKVLDYYGIAWNEAETIYE